MKQTAILTLTGTVILLSACAIGPRWQEPNMPVPAEFRGASISESTMADLPWQVVLSDPDLQSLLRDVFAHNRNLEAMQHNVNAARHYVTVQAAPLFPWLGYGGAVSKGMNNSGGSGIAHTSSTTTNPGSINLNASWELDIWGNTRKRVESAKAQAEAAEEDFNNMRISLMKSVACGYLQLIMLDEQLAIAKMPCSPTPSPWNSSTTASRVASAPPSRPPPPRRRSPPQRLRCRSWKARLPPWRTRFPRSPAACRGPSPAAGRLTSM